MRTTQSLGLTGMALKGDVLSRESATRRWALTASLHWSTLRDVRMQRGRISMTKWLLLIGLFLAVPLGAAEAQTGGINNQRSQEAPFQSLSPARSLCGAGSQGVRVCNSDFQSCNSACSSTFINDLADTSGCIQRCCNNFSACLSIRGCANLTSLDCSPTSTNRAIRNLRAQ
jgi:hypothetical protein